MNSRHDISAVCAVIPTYQNGATVGDVIVRIAPFVASVIVVNDGSTDSTAELLRSGCIDGVSFTLLTHSRNRGKGAALRTGLTAARERGFRYAVTIDADGQHTPEEASRLLAVLAEEPDALVVGSRGLRQPGMPGRNTFANRFSNFWFAVQTLRRLPDTQSGFRIYPLRHLRGLRLITARYEAELELLVFAAWHGVKILAVPISVFYPEAGLRVSHFRPLRDFGRISLLNTLLCFLAVVYALPLAAVRGIRKLFTR